MKTPGEIVALLILGSVAVATIVGEVVLRLHSGVDLPDVLLGVPAVVAAGVLGFMRGSSAPP